ncbi:PREDICTED: histone H1-like [Prunus mume]|uniref:Histone H1-like n=1 Tax=Prunus mume TaxID=102107 RepID=A0ABM0N1W2_PRUMU|nr:PREDICTED: histone H1-like [Prunus mume]
MTETDVKAKKARSPPSHPPFVEMITEAIVALKERTGSSQYAITKFVEEKNKNLPQTFRKLLLYNLKKLVASGKLVKVKNSFKLPPGRSAPVKEKPDAPKPRKSAEAVVKPKPKPKTVAKPKANVAAKPKPKAAAKPKLKAVATKPKAAVKPKAKPAAAKPAAKVARTSTRTSPGKKVEVKAKAKKPVAPARAVKKPKSVKSPVKKKAQAKKGKK